MSEPCPSQNRWKEHLDGTLPADEQAELNEHLDSCADCRKTLEMLAGGSDSLLDVARQAGEATDASTPALNEVLAKFQAPPSETQAEPADARDDSLCFLTPSDKPGCLGRLGHYEVQEVIGKGGFGIVLKAFDEKLHRVVAIKVLSPAYAAIGSARKRFIREAQSAAAVKNEHVVAIYSVKDEAQPPYLVMELIDGISLQQKLDQKGSLSIKELLRIGLQTAEGLAAAHKQGLVHRDIKPANILLENGVERVRITDFGLARAVDDASITQSGTVAGTPMYMSPEQAEGLPIDHRSDLFSLGTVLYAMCTGHPPFRASGTHAVLKRVIDAAPRPIREINSEIPDLLCAIISKLHAKNPNERFQTAKEVAELLGQHLAEVQQPTLLPGAALPNPLRGVSSGSGEPRRAQAATLPRVREHLRLKLAVGLVVVAVFIGFIGKYLWFRDNIPLFSPKDLTGIWVGGTGDWGQIALQGINFGGYTGTYSGTNDRQPGHLRIMPSDVGGPRFQGQWWEAGKVPQGVFRADVASDNRSIDISWEATDGNSTAAKKGYSTWRRLEGPADLVVNWEDPNLLVQLVKMDGSPPISISHDSQTISKFICPGSYRLVANLDGVEVYNKPLELVGGQKSVVGIPVAGWVQLFNGKDLTGWTNPRQAFGPWKVDQGVLIGKGDEALLRTERGPFGDFHLRMEARYVGTARLLLREQSPDVAGAGYQCMMENTPKGGFNTGGVALTHTKNAMGHFAVPTEVLTQRDQWFTLEVIANGNCLQTFVDGKKAVDFVDIHSEFMEGFIGLMVWGKESELHIKKIEIKELPPEQRGWTRIFNGTDLNGWNPPQRNKWKVEEGALIGYGSKGYLGSTDNRFANFHLRLEAMINADGWGGVAFRNTGEKHGSVSICPKLGKTGSLYFFNKLLHQPEKQLASPDTWLNLELIVQGKNVVVLVNGTKTVEARIDGLPERGPILLTADAPGTVIRFRKIEIKKLPPIGAPPQAVAPFDQKKAKELQGAWARHLGVDVEITNLIGMKLRLIPPGEYMMGSSPEEIAWLLKEVPDLKDASDNVRSEGPQRRVVLEDPFYMGVHEVTVGHFREFVRATKYRTEAETAQGGVNWYNDLKKWERKPENVWNNVDLSGEDTHPVVFVTLADAQAFCAWLTTQEGRAYAVPAEEQWEWACRAGATTHWFFGNDALAMKDFGWTTPRSEGKLRPVGRLAPNPFGLCDIYGNANELTMNLQRQAVGRGGEAGESPHRARSASRFAIKKEYDPSYRRGFRVVIVGNLRAKTPSSIDQILKDATLIMNFEKDTFYQREGKTYVRDLSGQGNDGLCDQVAYTPNGQAGGALACKGGALWLRKGLLNKLPEYTVATWINVDFSKEANFRLLTQGAFRDEKEDEPVFGIQVRLTNMFIDSWNRDMQPKKWKVLHLDFPALEPGWNFVAARLRQGGVGTGELVVTRNDKTLKGDLQMLKADDQQLLVGYRQPGAVDELVIWPRALSDEDLQVIYQQGLTKKPLRSGPPSETWVPLFNGKDLTGWQTHPDQPGDWRVDHEGHLVCTSGANVSHLFYMPKEFANFHLRAVVKINQPGDSGLCFRCRYDPLVAVNSPIKNQPNGYEAQIRDIQLGMIIDISEGKAPAFLSQGTPVAADAWALLEVIANGNRITSKVNGNLVKEITSDSHTRGRIAVQHANVKTAVHFKKIEIKELPPNE